MIKIFKNKKILLILIPILSIVLFIFLNNKPTKIETTGISINSNHKQYFKTEKNVKKLKLKNFTTTRKTVKLKNYNL